jgi:uncharacterized membrane protein
MAGVIMEPLITLVVVTLALLAAGRLGIRVLRPWPIALRGGLAAMFVLTGVSHFVGMRERLIAMVPEVLPAPDVIVAVTGLLELAGAIGLLIPRVAPWAAGGLTLLLIGMFPANVHLALTGADLDPSDELLPRTMLQVVFVAAAVTALVTSLRSARVPERESIAEPAEAA